MNFPSSFMAPSTVLLAATIALGTVVWAQTNASLRGDNVVPTVATEASGDASITIAADKSVTGSIRTTDIAGTAAHIHRGAPGEQGPVIVTLTKSADNVWIVPAGVVMNDEQYESFRSGLTYVDVHSAANPNGEIRAQLSP